MRIRLVQLRIVVIVCLITCNFMPLHSVAQPTLISTAQYEQLPLQRKADTASYYMRTYWNYSSIYPGKGPTDSLKQLVKYLMKSVIPLLAAPDKDVSNTIKVKLYADKSILYISTFFNADSCLFYINEGIARADKDTSLYIEKINMLIAESVLYNYFKNESFKAVEVGKEIIDIASLHKDTLRMVTGYTKVADAYYNCYDTAMPVMDYWLKAATLAGQIKLGRTYNEALIDVMDYMTEVYVKYHDTAALQQAHHYMIQLEQYNQQNHYRVDKSNMAGYYYKNIAFIYLYEKDTARFLKYADSVNIIEKNGIFDFDEGSYLTLYSLYLFKNYRQFIDQIHKSYPFKKDYLLSEDRLHLLQMTSNSFAALKQYDSAYVYKSQYSDMLDSVSNDKQARQVKTLFEQNRLAQKQHDIDQLQNKNRRGIIIALIITLMLITGIFILYIRIRIKEAKMQKRLADLDNATQQQILELEEKAGAAKQEERKKLGMELHDDLAGSLAAIKYKLDLLRKNNQDEAQQAELKNILDNLSQAYDSTRSKSHELYAAENDASFSERIHSILNKTLPSSINLDDVAIEEDAVKGLSINVKIEILRIIKESITNIIKHAKADKIELLLHKEEDKIALLIKDDGRGFNVNAVKPGVGLRSIQNRISDMGGKLSINSSAEAGTELLMELPA